MKLRYRLSILTCVELFFMITLNNADIAQRLPPVCLGWSTCPHFVDDHQWIFYTLACCGNHPGLTFHCQEQYHNHTLLAVSGCLPEKTCPAGTFAYLNITKGIWPLISTLSSLCLPCMDGSYEPKSALTVTFQQAYCRWILQECSNEYGKMLVKQGNATDDTRCRCLWEKGYGPQELTEECVNPDGFHSHAFCSCHLYRPCTEGKQFTKDYSCVPVIGIPTNGKRISSSKGPTSQPQTTKIFTSGVEVIHRVDYPLKTLLAMAISHLLVFH